MRRLPRLALALVLCVLSTCLAACLGVTEMDAVDPSDGTPSAIGYELVVDAPLLSEPVVRTSSLVVERDPATGWVRRAPGILLALAFEPLHDGDAIRLLFPPLPESHHHERAVVQRSFFVAGLPTARVFEETFVVRGCEGGLCDVEWEQESTFEVHHLVTHVRARGEGTWDVARERYLEVVTEITCEMVLDGDDPHIDARTLTLVESPDVLADFENEEARLADLGRAARDDYATWVATHSIEEEVEEAVRSSVRGVEHDTQGCPESFPPSLPVFFHARAHHELALSHARALPTERERECAFGAIALAREPMWSPPERDLAWAEEHLLSNDPYARVDAAAVLYEVGDRRGIEVLLDALETRSVEEQHVFRVLADRLPSLLGFERLGRIPTARERAAPVARIRAWAVEEGLVAEQPMGPVSADFAL